MTISTNTLLVRAAHLMDTGLARTIEPWRSLLGSETHHPALLGEEVRTHLLLFLAANNGVALPEKVLIYLEYRCRWLDDRQLFSNELGIPAVDRLLTRVHNLLNQQTDLFLQHIKKTDELRRIRRTDPAGSPALLVPDDITVATCLHSALFLAFLDF